MSDYLAKLKNQKQATGALPKLSKGKNSGKEPYNSTAKTVKRAFGSKDSTPVGHFSGKKNQQIIPPPEPPDLGPEYEALWNRAWELADIIDSDAKPYSDRMAMMPELNRLRARMWKIERSKLT